MPDPTNTPKPTKEQIALQRGYEESFLIAKHEAAQDKIRLGTNALGLDGHLSRSGINYESTNLADGHYGKAAREGEWSKWSAPDDMAYEAFKQQDVGDLIVDSLAGGSKLAVAGFLDSVGSWDLMEMSNVATGQALSHTGNWAQELGNKFQESAQKENTVYKNGDSMWNMAYWASQGQQLGYSVGIIAETLAEQALLAATTGGGGNLLGLATKGKMMSSLLKQGAMGITGGLKESFMNARETQESVYEKFKSNGATEEEARAKADEAATIAFRTEAGALMAINTLQNLSLFGGISKRVNPFARGAGAEVKTGFSSFGEELLGKALPKGTSKLQRRAIQYGVIPSITEGMEEGIQTSAGAYGEWAVGDKKEPFDPFNTEFRDSVIGGALGGVFLGAGSKAINMFQDRVSNKAFKKDYKSFMEEANTRTANTFIQKQAIEREYEDARVAYNKNKTPENLATLNKSAVAIKEAKYNSNLANAINALQLDYVKGEGTTAFDSHIGQMQIILDAVNKNDTAVLKEHGLITEEGKERFEGSFQVIKDTFEQNIKDSEFIKGSLEKNLSDVTSDFSSAFDVTRKEFMNSKHLEERNKIDSELQQAYALDSYASQLSPGGLTKFRLENELHALNQVHADSQTKPLTTEELERKTEIEEELKDLSYTQNDKLVVPNINNQDYINAEVSKISYGQIIGINNEELTGLRNPEKIKEKVEARVAKKVETAKTIEQVEEAITDAEETAVVSGELFNAADRKAQEIAKREAIAKVDKGGKTITKPSKEEVEVDNKPVENSKEPEPDVNSFLEGLASGKFSSDSGQEGLEGQAFSRRLSDDAATEADIESAKRIAARKDEQFGRETTLEDFIIDSIERNGYAYTEEFFNGLAHIYKLAGRDTSTQDAIYDKYFNDEHSLALKFTTPEQAENASKSAVVKAVKATEPKDTYGLHGAPVSAPKATENDGRTNKSQLKLAYNTQEYDREGDVFTTTSKELKGEVLFMLDSKFMNEGDVLLAEIDDNPDQEIAIVTPEGKSRTTTWGEYRKTIEVGSSLYNSKVPIKIYKMVDGEKVYTGTNVHDSTWYIAKNINSLNGDVAEQQRIAKEGHANAEAFRQQLFENGGSMDIQITAREFGAIDTINKQKEKPLNLQEATGGHTQLALVMVDENNTRQLKLDFGGQANPNINIINSVNDTNNGKNLFRSGQLADIRYAYTDASGKDFYMLFPTMNTSSLAPQPNLRQDLSPEIFNSLKFATLARIVLNNTDVPELVQAIEAEYGITITDAQNIAKSIADNTKIDIKGRLNDYFELFVYMGGTSMKLEGGGVINLSTLINNFSIPEFNKAFGEKGTALKSKFNVSKKRLNGTASNQMKIPVIDAQGKVNVKYDGYNDVVKANTLTNVRSHEITKQDGTKEWIIDVHPTMTFAPVAKPVGKKEGLSSAEKAAQETLKDLGGKPTEVVQTPTADNISIPSELLEQLSEEEIRILNSLGNAPGTTQQSRRTVSEATGGVISSKVSDGRVDGLSDPEFRELVSALKNKFISNLDFEAKLTVKELQNQLAGLVEAEINPVLEQYNKLLTAIDKYPSLAPRANELRNRITKLETTISQQEKLVGNKGILLKELNKLFGLNLEDDTTQDENFSKSSLEKDIKLSYSNKLKMSFFGIPKLRDNSSEEVMTDLTNFSEFEDADHVENVLKSVTTEIPSDWGVLMSKLDAKYRESGKPIYNQLKNQLKDLPVHLQNEILYKLISSRFTAHKVILAVQSNKDGADSYVLTVIDENSAKENIKLKRQIRSNFTFDSPLTMIDVQSNDFILNLDVAKKYQAAFNKHIKENTFKDGYTIGNAKTLKDIFEAIGITLSDNTIKNYLELNDPFSKKQGILTFVNIQLNKLVEKASKAPLVVTDPGNNLFDTSHKALNKLIETEIALNGTNLAKSIRVGGKTLQGVIQNTSAYDTLKELLAEDSVMLDNLLSVGYSKDNLLLNLLKDNPQMREILDLSYGSPEALKVTGKDSYSDTSYDKLAERDGLIGTFGLYTNDRNIPPLKDGHEVKLGLNFRTSQMPFMTLSDKGRMLYLRTIALNAEDSQLTADMDEIKISNSILDLLFEQSFVSEYNRILDAYTEEDPQINAFSEGSKIFTFLPIFNTLKVDVEGVSVNIHDIIKERVKNGEALPSVDAFKEGAKTMLSAYINSEVDQKLNSKGEGIIEETKIFADGKINSIDSKYLSKFKGTDLEKGRKFFAEHAVNNFMHQINLYQTFLGDMAYFSKLRGIVDAEGFVNSDVIEKNYLDIAETIGQVVDKRSAMLIAPGGAKANSNNAENNNSQYLQLQLLDVRSVSSTIEPLIRASKDEVSAEEEAAFTVLNDDTASKDAKSAALKVLEDSNEELRDYFDIEGTDAQEYSTWKEHIDTLFRQGNLTVEEEALLKSAYTKLSAGKFDEVTKAETKFIMQPLKPLYSGMVPLKNKDGKVISMRPVYIKSSSFPLLPQVTKNLKLDNLRKNLEALEEKQGMPVRASYQTANKIGSNKTLLTTQDLYDNSFEGLSKLMSRDGRNVLESAAVVLDTRNFKIQQENPDKTTKYLAKNKDNEISLGSQFWKVITANGINKIKGKVFPNLFGKDLLDLIGIENTEMLSGEDIDKINIAVYDKYSAAKMDLLYSRLGLDKNIPFDQFTKAEKRDVLQNILDIIEEEVTTRNYPDYLTEVLNLITDDQGNVSLEAPLFLDTNANKFESLLLSLVANATIFHKLPGLGHISSSSEGFEKSTNLEQISEGDREGITWFNGIPGQLKSTVLENGTISESEVLIKSHFRRTRMVNGEKVTELVDLSSDTYSEMLPDGTGRRLKLEMMDEELLSNFSFRIPTSSHQSGVIIKVVGFLPPESADMLVVPVEHTVQLGEDYDIDKRYLYKSNYVFDGDKISKLNYTKDLRDDAVEGEEESNKDLKTRIKMYENAMIDIYKSVYQAPSKEVQQKIFRPLSVGVAKKTAGIMDKKLNADKQPHFSTLSDTYQRKLLKAGADGKGGIGVHSNAVTFEAQMQKLADGDKLQLRQVAFDDAGKPYYVPTVVTIGGLNSQSALGATKDFMSLDGKRSISDQHGENQNVSTDNINEQIMAKRNENSYTMSVYALMASRGFDLSTDAVAQNNGKPMHIPSLFINQPIIRDYVRLKSQQDSISGEFVADKDAEILNKLLVMYNGRVAQDAPTLSSFMDETEYQGASKRMSGQNLYDSLSTDGAKKDNVMQLAVLQKFSQLRDEALQVSEVQQLISLSTGGLGVSYFETLQRIATLNKLPGTINNAVQNAYKLVGEYATSSEDTIDGKDNPDKKVFTPEYLADNGYTKIGEYFWKPTTIEGRMLINSLKGSQELMDIFFPYKGPAIDTTIRRVLAQKGLDPADKSAAILQQKYEVMRELRSFMSTYKDAGFYSGDINQERRRLFMDTEGNLSLAAIVKDIQNRKLPLASNPFIRNLSPQIKAVTEPSLLLYDSESTSTLDSSSEYNGFERMWLDDTTILGTYNGEELTPRMLMQDLMSYALLADSQKGATGFETLIPVKVLAELGYNDALRDNFNKANNDPTMFNIFVEQYFQHNPNKTQILSGSTIQAKQIITNDEKLQGKLKSLSAKQEQGEQVNLTPLLKELKSFKILDEQGEEGITKFKTYVAIRNPSIDNSTNKFNLYKYNESTAMYEQIPTLGTLGVKEYNADTLRQPSMLPSLAPLTKTTKQPNGQYKYYDLGAKVRQVLPQVELQLPASLGPKGILEAYAKSPNTNESSKEFIASLLEYGNLDAKIVYTKPAGGALGQYNSQTNEIYIHPDIYDKLLSENPNLSEVRDIVREVIIEEIIHSMTVKEFNKFVKSYNVKTGEIQLVENAPLFATKLVSLYQSAKAVLPYKPSDTSTYYSKDIYEFMAGMFVAPDYRKALEKADPGIIKRFLDTLKDMLGSLYTNVTGKTLSYKDETFSAVYDLLKATKAVESSTEVVSEIPTVKNPMDTVLEQDKQQTKPEPVKRPEPPTKVAPQSNKPYYEGNITPDANTVFVFGSNPEGRHGAGAAKIAKDQFGAKYGQGEGLQGNAYALPTKDLRVKENKGLKSISPSVITDSIIDLYEVARQNPDKQFKVAYRNTDVRSLNGYTGLEMIDMFKGAAYDMVLDKDGEAQEVYNIPPNVIFSKEWFDTGLFNNTTLVEGPVKVVPKQTSIQPTKDGKFELNEDQKKAKKEILDFFDDTNRTTHSLIGYAGTGKTTLLNEIYEEINSPFSNVLFTSPTHRANAVIKLKNPKLTVLTLHSLLGLGIEQDLETFDAKNAKFATKNDTKLERGDILIVDESSMINDELFKHLGEVAERLGVKILFVGDNAQLKPVKQAHESKALTSTEGKSTLNMVMRANNQELLDESMYVRAEGKFTYTNNPTNTGVEFSADRPAKMREAYNMFKSEEFKENPLLVRILSGTNKEVDLINGQMVEALFGKDAEEFPKGLVLMGYNNWKTDYNTKQPKISNGGDYAIERSSGIVKKTIAGVSVEGYNIEVKNLLDPRASLTETFVLSKNTPIEKIEALGSAYENQRLQAMRLRGRQAAIAWQSLTALKDSFVTTVPITYRGRTKIGKTFDYGYAHTIHKSQGGTYDNVYVLDNTIDVFRDPTLEKQLRYVAVTRAADKATIITGKPITEGKPTVKEEVKTQPTSLASMLSSGAFTSGGPQDSRQRLPVIKNCK